MRTTSILWAFLRNTSTSAWMNLLKGEDPKVHDQGKDRHDYYVDYEYDDYDDYDYDDDCGDEDKDSPVHKLLGNFLATLGFFSYFQVVEQLSMHRGTSKSLCLYSHSHTPATSETIGKCRI